MALTRKATRLWHQSRLRELEHQSENAYLFAENEDDLKEMRSALFAEWCAVSTAAKMEVPPEHFLRGVADQLGS